MKLIFKQRIFSFLDAYDITDEYGNTVFTVKSEFALGHEMHVYDKDGYEVGVIKQRFLHIHPTFEIWINGRCEGYIKKKFTLFRQSFILDYGSYEIEGDALGWDYSVVSNGRTIMTITKRLFKLSDTYEIEINYREDLIPAVLIALAIDAEKCSRG